MDCLANSKAPQKSYFAPSGPCWPILLPLLPGLGPVLQFAKFIVSEPVVYRIVHLILLWIQEWLLINFLRISDISRWSIGARGLKSPSGIPLILPLLNFYISGLLPTYSICLTFGHRGALLQHSCYSATIENTTSPWDGTTPVKARVIRFENPQLNEPSSQIPPNRMDSSGTDEAVNSVSAQDREGLWRKMSTKLCHQEGQKCSLLSVSGHMVPRHFSISAAMVWVTASDGLSSCYYQKGRPVISRQKKTSGWPTRLSLYNLFQQWDVAVASSDHR